MSGNKIKKPIVLDETAQEIAKALHTQNLLLNVMAGANLEAIQSISEVKKIVQSGKAEEVFNIGDQIIVPWTDVATGRSYEVPFDVVHFGDVTLKDGEVVPGMFLQWHYATPFGVQFDQYEAFYYCTEELPAGTYNITVGASWGTNCKIGEKYQFVLTKPVPAGGQLAGFYGMPDQAPANWKVYSFKDGKTTEPIETVAVTSGSAGTSLGSFVPAGEEKLNSLHRLAYGYNRWSQSAIRQWLNSKAAVGAWWESQNNYDRIPDQNATKAGFLSGFDDEFLSCVQPIKVTTALNTVTDTAAGESEDTYDTFFLPSLEQMYCTPQKSGVEGDFWEYWKRASGLTSPMAQYQTYPQARTFAIENHASPQTVRLRSADRGIAYSTWYITSGGYVSINYAIGATRCAPACVICASKDSGQTPLTGTAEEEKN